MEDAARVKGPDRSGRDAPEIRVVGIEVKPAPDAQARLRRLFSILVELAEDDLPSSSTDPLPGGYEEEEG